MADADAVVKEIIADCIQARIHGNQAFTHMGRSGPAQRGQREAIQHEAQRIAELIRQLPETLSFKGNLVAVCTMMSDVYQQGKNTGAERDGTIGQFWAFMGGLSRVLGKPINPPQTFDADGNYPRAYGGMNAVFHGQRSLTDYLGHVVAAHGPDAETIIGIFLPDAAL